MRAAGDSQKSSRADGPAASGGIAAGARTRQGLTAGDGEGEGMPFKPTGRRFPGSVDVVTAALGMSRGSSGSPESLEPGGSPTRRVTAQISRTPGLPVETRRSEPRQE